MRTRTAFVLMLAAAPAAWASSAGKSGSEEILQPGARDASKQRIEALSWKYDVPESQIEGLRESGMEWADIEKALVISRQARRPLSEVVSLRSSGLDWEDVGKKLGFRPGAPSMRDEEPERLRDAVRQKKTPPPKAPPAKAEPKPKPARAADSNGSPKNDVK